jgi:hypothetical protein
MPLSSPQQQQQAPHPASPQPQPQPLTPLQQRQWQRATQRSVRLAVTAFKAGRSRLQEAADAGTTAATQLTNSLLTAQMLPDMAMPAALAAVEGLQAAARAKLQRQQQAQLQQLAAAVAHCEAAVATMAAALADVEAQLSTGAAAATGSSGSSAAAAAGDSAAAPAAAAVSPAAARLLRAVPVFHTLALPEASGLLQRILQMHQQDVAIKQRLLQSFAAHVAAARAGPGASSSRGHSSSDASLRDQLTVAITSWMVAPPVNVEEAEQLLQVLADEMTGF